ncbi:hypothetical protein IMZ48_17295 [Candidatus Bathyarchaeota archaeon]|nr:hypothetical protein [Candidatus Bathyarchaeota archaeon]
MKKETEKMARGNQREKARENNLKKQAAQVRKSFKNRPVVQYLILFSFSVAEEGEWQDWF